MRVAELSRTRTSEQAAEDRELLPTRISACAIEQSAAGQRSDEQSVTKKSHVDRAVVVDRVAEVTGGRQCSEAQWPERLRRRSVAGTTPSRRSVPAAWRPMNRLTLDELAYRVLPQVAPGRAFADSEWRTLTLVAEALLVDLPFVIDPARVADNVERFLCEGRSRRAWRCRVLMTLLESLPLLTHGKLFSRLDRVQRRALFETRIVDGRGLWGLCAKVRYLVLMGAYGDECVPSSLGVLSPGERRSIRRVRRDGSLPLVS